MYPVNYTLPFQVLNPSTAGALGNFPLQYHQPVLTHHNTDTNTLHDSNTSKCITSSHANNDTITSNINNSARNNDNHQLNADKSNKAQFVQGLSIHIAHPSEKKSNVDECSLMTMFESCTRSNKYLKIKSTLTPDAKEWISLLHIDDLFICSGRAKRLRPSKVSAADQALQMLLKCQPIKYKPRQEMSIGKDEKLPGFTLFLTSSSPGGRECLESLRNSCIQCNLDLTLWHDKGEVFGAEHATVLLINSKPICLATAKDLEGAKRAAARRAVDVLRVNHEVSYNKHRTHRDERSRRSITPRSRVSLQPSLTRIVPCDLPLPPESTASLKSASPAASFNSGSTTTVKGVDPAPTQSNHTSSIKKLSPSSNYVTETSVPGLTLYIPHDKHSNKGPHSTLQRSAALCNLSIRFKDIGKVDRNGTMKEATAMLIGDSVVAWGFGDDTKAAKADVSWQKALDTLMKSTKVLYYSGKSHLATLSSIQSRKMQVEKMRKGSKERGKEVDDREQDDFIRRKVDESRHLLKKMRHKDEEADDDELDVKPPKKLFIVCSEWTGSGSGDEETMSNCDDVIQWHIMKAMDNCK